MYAVIETGGKQYRVEVGQELQVELLDVEPGNTVTLDRVLLVADGDESSIGQPLVSGAAVSAEVLRQDRGDKVISFKYRPKARRRVKKGHRQELTDPAHQRHRRRWQERGQGRRQGRVGRQDGAPAPRGGCRRAGRQGRRARREAGCDDRQAGDEVRIDHEDRQAQGRRQAGRRREGPESKAEAAPAAAKPKKPSAKAAATKGDGDEAGTQEGRQAARHQEGRVVEMAHKKAGGSVKNGRDSVGQRLGVKAGDGQLVPAGSIIVRQRGMTFLAGPGTGLGRDYTVFATVTGKVRFEHATKSKKRIRVEAVEAAPTTA